MKKRFSIVAVGSGDPSRPPLWIGYLKTFLEQRSVLKGFVKMEILLPPKKRTFDGVFEGLPSHDPDLITITPHEDWDGESMFKLCRRIKDWKADLPIVVCAENPRNRITIEQAKESGVIDAVIHGEAEKPLEDLVLYYSKGGEYPVHHENLICIAKAAARSKA